jgi:hypothetical protein
MASCYHHQLAVLASSEQLLTIMDDHSQLSKMALNFLQSIRNAVACMSSALQQQLVR